VWAEFDPKNTSYTELLDLFWKSHDPTYEPPTAYRSAIWAVGDDQWRTANASLQHMKDITVPPSQIYTRVHDASAWTFWPAEAYHQHYVYKSGEKCPPDSHIPAPEACPDVGPVEFVDTGGGGALRAHSAARALRDCWPR